MAWGESVVYSPTYVLGLTITAMALLGPPTTLGLLRGFPQEGLPSCGGPIFGSFGTFYFFLCGSKNGLQILGNGRVLCGTLAPLSAFGD